LTERTIARCAVKVGSATICRARGLYGVINDCIAAETNGRSFFLRPADGERLETAALSSFEETARGTCPSLN
jgi:hypothetical protein